MTDKSHQLIRLADRIFGVPLAITSNKLNTILSVIGDRINLQAFDGFHSDTQIIEHESLGVGTGVAIIPIIGTLVHRAINANPASGLISYEAIAADFKTAVSAQEVKTIVLDIDSNGGEMNGLFDLVEILNAKNDKPVIAFINETATSAAYLIASTADKIIMPSTGAAGCIGVIALHVDQSQHDANEGLKFTSITSSARKLDGDPHQPLSKQARETIQTEVDRVAELLFETVAANRPGLTIQALRDLEGAVVFGNEARDRGFVDQIDAVSTVMHQLQADQRLDSNGGPVSILDNNLFSSNENATMVQNIVLLIAGSVLTSTLTEHLEKMITDDVSRNDVFDGIAKAVNMNAADVKQVISGKKDCPVTSFAKALNIPEDVLTDAAKQDKEALDAASNPQPVANTNVIQIDTARKEADGYAIQVMHLCDLAGCSNLAAGFVENKTPLAQISSQLHAEYVAAAAAETTSQHSASNGTQDWNWDKAFAKAAKLNPNILKA